MWLILFLPFLCISRTFDEEFAFLKLRYSILYISEQSSDWEEIQKTIENITKNSEAFCHEKLDEERYNLCKDVIDAFQTLHFATENQVDKIMKNIPIRSEVLYVFNTINDLNLDFNYLNNKKKVVISDPNYAIEDTMNSKTSLQTQAIKKIQSIIFNKNTINRHQKNEDMVHIKINGNIKYRVSYLVINNCKISINDFDLDIDTLVLINSPINNYGSSIRTTNLLVNSISHLSIIKDIDNIKSRKMIQVHQYGFFYDDSDQEFSKLRTKDDSDDTDVIDLDYRIVFQKDCWQLFTKQHEDDENYTTKDHLYFPYEFCDNFNLIVNSPNFDLNVNDTSIDNVKGVNITVANLYDIITPSILLLLEDSSNEVSITTSGFWSKLQKKPKIIVCLDDRTTLSPSSDVDIEQHKLYSYSPAPPLPDPTPLPPPEGPKYPRTSIIFVVSNITDCESNKKEFDTITMNYTDLCKDESVLESFTDYDDCCNYCKSYGEYLCSNGYDINSKLNKIAGHTDTLLILDSVEDMNVDFSNLREQMNVIVVADEQDTNSKHQMNAKRINKNIMNALKKNKKVIKDDDDDDDDWKVPHISIQGNITEKVSSLELIMLNVSVIDHEINVDSLVLFESCFNPKTEPIRSNYLVVDMRSHHHIITKPHRLDLIKVKQYGVEFFEEDISSDPTVYDFLPIDLRISFENDRWKVSYRKEGEEYDDEDYSYLPYNYADTLNIIIKSLNFDFHVENTLIQKAQPVNLTIKNLNPIESINKYMIKSDDEPKLKLTSSGSWDLFDKKPEIIVGLPISLDYSAPQSMTIKRENLYEFKRKTPPENPTSPFIFPVNSYLCISSIKSKCTKFQTEFEEEKEECEQNCKSSTYYSSFDGGYEECVSYYKAFGDSYISDGKDLNQILSSISNTTDNLFIMVYNVDDLTFDFNSLTDQISVVLASLNDDDDDDDIKYKNLISPHSMKNIKPKKLIKKRDDDQSYLKINLVGDISSKISCLAVIESNLNIIGSDLNINTLTLLSTKFAESENKIRSTNLIVDESTQAYILKNIDQINQKQLIKVNQYGYAPSDFGENLLISYDDGNYIRKDFQISFKNDRWLLLARKQGDKGDYEPYSCDGNEFGFIPYSFAESFNLIAKAFDFDFYVQDSAITKTKPVNVSLLQLQIVQVFGKLFYHKDVKITSSGNWAAVSNKTEVVFTVDDDEVSLQNDAKNIDVVKESIYSYVPKSQRTNDDGDDGGESSSETESGGGDDDGGNNDKNNNKMLIIIICSAAGAVVLIAIVIVIVCCVARKKKDNFQSSTVQFRDQLNQLLLDN